jgi:hypothetical protein
MARHAARTLPSSAAMAKVRRRNLYSRSSCVTATRPFSSTWRSRRRMRRRLASVGDVPRCRDISGIEHPSPRRGRSAQADAAGAPGVHLAEHDAPGAATLQSGRVGVRLVTSEES